MRKAIVRMVAAAGLVLVGGDALAVDVYPGKSLFPDNARRVCTSACRNNGMIWNGQWTNADLVIGVCGCTPRMKKRR